MASHRRVTTSVGQDLLNQALLYAWGDDFGDADLVILAASGISVLAVLKIVVGG